MFDWKSYAKADDSVWHKAFYFERKIHVIFWGREVTFVL